jgi:hypothetical protein
MPNFPKLEKVLKISTINWIQVNQVIGQLNWVLKYFQCKKNLQIINKKYL